MYEYKLWLGFSPSQSTACNGHCVSLPDAMHPTECSCVALLQPYHAPELQQLHLQRLRCARVYIQTHYHSQVYPVGNTVVHSSPKTNSSRRDGLRRLLMDHAANANAAVKATTPHATVRPVAAPLQSLSLASPSCHGAAVTVISGSVPGGASPACTSRM